MEVGGCANARAVELVNLPQLKKVVFDSGSFIRGLRCQIADVPVLESVHVGGNCFEMAGSFVLENAPFLKSLTLLSDCFGQCEELCLAHFKALEAVHLGENAFANVEVFVVDALPKLKRLVMEEGSCRGVAGDEHMQVVKLKSESGRRR